MTSFVQTFSRLNILPHFRTAPTGESHKLLIGHVPALLYLISCLVALSDNVVVTLTAQAKPETDDKCRQSKQSHVVLFGPAEPGNSMPALPTATALTQHRSSTVHITGILLAPLRNLHPSPFDEYFRGFKITLLNWETSYM